MEKRIYHCTKENWYKLKKEIKITIFSSYGTLDTPADKFLMRGQDVLLSKDDMSDDAHNLSGQKYIFKGR